MKETSPSYFDNTLQFILYIWPQLLHQYVGCDFLCLFIRINCLGIASLPGERVHKGGGEFPE